MKALIIMAHGSRNPVSNQEVMDLTQRVRKALKNQEVAHAFLDVLSPTLPETIDGLIKKGADEISILPLFLNSGNHVERDIPNMILDSRKKFPKAAIHLLRHIGAHPKYLQIVIEEAQSGMDYVVSL